MSQKKVAKMAKNAYTHDTHCLGRYIKENEMICGEGYVFLNAYTMGN